MFLPTCFLHLLFIRCPCHLFIKSHYYIIIYCKYLPIMANKNDVTLHKISFGVLQMTLKLCFMRLSPILARLLGKVLGFSPPQMFIDR